MIHSGYSWLIASHKLILLWASFHLRSHQVKHVQGQAPFKYWSICWRHVKKNKIFFTDPGSAPTSSMKTRPKSSSERRQRPSSMSCEIIIPIKLQWGLDRGHNKHYFKLFLIFINSLSIITFSVFESNRQFSQQPFWLGNRKGLHVLIRF